MVGYISPATLPHPGHTTEQRLHTTCSQALATQRGLDASLCEVASVLAAEQVAPEQGALCMERLIQCDMGALHDLNGGLARPHTLPPEVATLLPQAMQPHLRSVAEDAHTTCAALAAAIVAERRSVCVPGSVGEVAPGSGEVLVSGTAQRLTFVAMVAKALLLAVEQWGDTWAERAAHAEAAASAHEAMVARLAGAAGLCAPVQAYRTARREAGRILTCLAQAAQAGERAGRRAAAEDLRGLGRALSAVLLAEEEEDDDDATTTTAPTTAAPTVAPTAATTRSVVHLALVHLLLVGGSHGKVDVALLRTGVAAHCVRRDHTVALRRLADVALRIPLICPRHPGGVRVGLIGGGCDVCQAVSAMRARGRARPAGAAGGGTSGGGAAAAIGAAGGAASGSGEAEATTLAQLPPPETMVAFAVTQPGFAARHRAAHEAAIVADRVRRGRPPSAVASNGALPYERCPLERPLPPLHCEAAAPPPPRCDHHSRKSDDVTVVAVFVRSRVADGQQAHAEAVERTAFLTAVRFLPTAIGNGGDDPAARSSDDAVHLLGRLAGTGLLRVGASKTELVAQWRAGRVVGSPWAGLRLFDVSATSPAEAAERAAAAAVSAPPSPTKARILANGIELVLIPLAWYGSEGRVRLCPAVRTCLAQEVGGDTGREACWAALKVLLATRRILGYSEPQRQALAEGLRTSELTLGRALRQLPQLHKPESEQYVSTCSARMLEHACEHAAHRMAALGDDAEDAPEVANRMCTLLRIWEEAKAGQTGVRRMGLSGGTQPLHDTLGSVEPLRKLLGGLRVDTADAATDATDAGRALIARAFSVEASEQAQAERNLVRRLQRLRAAIAADPQWAAQAAAAGQRPAMCGADLGGSHAAPQVPSLLAHRLVGLDAEGRVIVERVDGCGVREPFAASAVRPLLSRAVACLRAAHGCDGADSAGSARAVRAIRLALHLHAAVSAGRLARLDASRGAYGVLAFAAHPSHRGEEEVATYIGSVYGKTFVMRHHDHHRRATGDRRLDARRFQLALHGGAEAVAAALYSASGEQAPIPAEAWEAARALLHEVLAATAPAAV